MDNIARILALIAQNGSGSQGTMDYNKLTNKPSLGGVTIVGNMDFEDLHLNAMWVGTSAQYEIDKDDIEDGTLVFITDDDTIDSVPTQNSTNLVTSGGVYAFVVSNTLPASTKYAANATFSMNGNSFVCTLTLKDQNGDTIGTPQSIDLPLETMVIGGSYNDTTKSIVLTLKSGDTLNIPVGDLVRGLQTEITVENKLNADLVDDTTAINKFVTAAQKAKIGEIDDKYPKAWDVELTQAEYDALPNTKYVDGKNYYITDGDPDKPIIYGFRIDPDESDPSDAVTYLMDAVGMEPVVMGATSFNYGSWKNAFFMPKPCMLKYDGTVDYYLDPNDFTKKVDGTASDVGNINYAGNAMMEFPKIWFKFEAGAANGEGYFYVSNQKVDDTYRCWCNMDADGNEIDHFYVHIYNGVIYDGKMRSLSGMKLTPWSTTVYSSSATYAVNSIVNYDSKMWKCVTAVETAEAFDSTKWEQFAFNGNTDGTQEVNSATANNTTAKSEWYIDTWCDRVLITALLYLMGKSLNLQATFGRGIDSGSQTAAEAYVTGAANDKGLFYGSTSNGNTVVKVFGIENFWACKWHRTAGLIGNSSGGYSYKMTASTADGSSVSGYNSNGNGYLTTTFNRPTSNYVRLMEFGAHGALPLDTTGATSTTYCCNYFYTGTGFALVGGISNDGAGCGFYVLLSAAFGSRYWNFAAALSCKPLAQKG